MTALDLIKCLIQTKKQGLLLTCAPISELPPNIRYYAQHEQVNLETIRADRKKIRKMNINVDNLSKMNKNLLLLFISNLYTIQITVQNQLYDLLTACEADTKYCPSATPPPLPRVRAQQIHLVMIYIYMYIVYLFPKLAKLCVENPPNFC